MIEYTEPTLFNCKYCNNSSVSIVKKEPGFLTYVFSVLLCCACGLLIGASGLQVDECLNVR